MVQKNQQLKHEVVIILRRSLVCCGSFLASILVSPPSWADGDSDNKGEDEGVAGAFKSLFDQNEKTKSGKVLPKAYLKSAREVVKTLRESLKEDTTDTAKFRRTADAAKESTRNYLSNWRGQPKELLQSSPFSLILIFS